MGTSKQNVTKMLSARARKAIGSIRPYYQYVLAAILILVLVLIVYGGDLEILANEASQDETLSYIFLVPFFAGILFYLKKDKVKASLALEENRKKTKTKYLDELVGAVLCVLAFLMYWYGSHTFYPLEIHVLSLPIFVLGVTLILLNMRATLALILPTLFMVFLVPIPAEFVYSLGGAMGNFNTQASYSLLKILSLPVTLSTSYGPPTLVLTSSHGAPASFTVDLPCSGIYSLIAFAMFAAFLLLVTSASAPRKIAAVLVGFIIFEVFNVIRITAIVSVAYKFGQEIAMNLVHALAGLLLIFIGMLFTLFIAERVFKVQVMPPTKKHEPCPSCETSLQKGEGFCFNCGRLLNRVKTSVSREFWAKLLLLILICFIVTLSINAPTFAIAQGPKGTAYTENWANSTTLFPNITGYQPERFLYEDLQYEQIAHQEAAFWCIYYPTNLSQSSVYVDVGVADSISNLHNWEVCLVYYSTTPVTVLDSRDIEILPDVPLIGQYFTFTSPANYTQITLYWYEKATFNTGITVGQKYVRISLVVLTQNATNTQQIEDQLLPIGQVIASYWQPLINSSLISLGVPTLQALLAVFICMLAFTETTRYFSELRQRDINQKLFNTMAPKDERAILKTLKDVTAEKKVTRTADIQEALERNTHKSIDEDTLRGILTHFEEYGFIKKDVASVDNNPVLVWKNLTLEASKEV